jgi:hypothetical protein
MSEEVPSSEVHDGRWVKRNPSKEGRKKRLNHSMD